MKTVVILEHNGGRLGNQLWFLANVYAYCLERGYACRNLSFYQYDRFYRVRVVAPGIDTMLRLIPGRIKQRLHSYLMDYIKAGHRAELIDSESAGPKPWYLPPTVNTNTQQMQALQTQETALGKYIYMSGWMFRNPVGLKKYNRVIARYLQPKSSITAPVDTALAQARAQFEHIVGVHVRKGDYRMFAGGQFYFTEYEVRPILDAYMQTVSKHTAFLICSDELLDEKAFAGLDIVRAPGHPVADLYALSKTDILIGSDSTFGGVAAYLGDIPFVVFSHDPIDWKSAGTRFSYERAPSNLQL